MDENDSIFVNNKRIVRNTAMLYVRMFLILPISFVITRQLLDILGFEDFGISNVIGGIVSAFSFISGMISSSVSRYYNFELARNDIGNFIKTFNTSLQIFFCVALVILVLSETAGLYIFCEKTAIAPGKFNSALIFYQFTIAVFIVNIFAIPYYSLVISHEDMGYFSFVSILEVALKLGSIYVLYANLFQDKLAFYGFFLFLIALIHFAAYFVYCRVKYAETKFDFSFHKEKFFELVIFSGWNLWGAGANLFSNVLINILLNNYFGSIVNAARTVSMQISTGIVSFSSNFMTAARPQIVKYWASGNVGEAHLLVSRAARLAFYMVFVLAMPIFLETDKILGIWLVETPPNSVQFTRLIIIQNLIDVLSGSIITLILATGRIAMYQAVVGFSIWLNFPLSYIAIYCFDFAPESVFYIAIFIAFFCLLMRIMFLKRLSGMMPDFFVKNALWGCVKVFVVAFILSFLFKYYFEYYFGYFIVMIFSFCITVVSIFLFGLDNQEMSLIKSVLKKKLKDIMPNDFS